MIVVFIEVSEKQSFNIFEQSQNLFEILTRQNPDLYRFSTKFLQYCQNVSFDRYSN